MLEEPENGRVIINNLRPGGVARYSCDSGYFLSGNLQRTCGLQGLWSGQTPTCKRKKFRNKICKSRDDSLHDCGKSCVSYFSWPQACRHPMTLPLDNNN